jgi:hypothetical protein
MKLGKAVLLIVLIFPYCLAQDGVASKHVSPVDFFKEDITLAINDGFAEISGAYYFRNNTERDGRIPIAFPFYVDSLSLYPDEIEAFMIDENDTTCLDYRDSEKQMGIMIGIPLIPGQITIWYLNYRQRILAPKARYILTSTAAWGKPLEEATYCFVVPSSFENIRAWPEPDTVIEEGARREYLARRTDFMPTQNMEIEWKSK